MAWLRPFRQEIDEEDAKLKKHDFDNKSEKKEDTSQTAGNVNKKKLDDLIRKKKVAAFEELEDLVCNLDTGLGFCKGGGMGVLIQCLQRSETFPCRHTHIF
jgi:hypothetical protein